MGTWRVESEQSVRQHTVEATTTAQLETTSILSSVANYKKECDTIVLDDDVYCCLLVDPPQW